MIVCFYITFKPYFMLTTELMLRPIWTLIDISLKTYIKYITVKTLIVFKRRDWNGLHYDKFRGVSLLLNFLTLDTVPGYYFLDDIFADSRRIAVRNALSTKMEKIVDESVPSVLQTPASAFNLSCRKRRIRAWLIRGVRSCLFTSSSCIRLKEETGGCIFP